MIDSLFRGFFGYEKDKYPFGGDGSDGEFNTTGNYSFSDSEGSLVVKQYSSFTINTGHTVSCTNNIKALVILVQKDVVIKGTLDMDGKSYHDSQNTAGYIIENNFASIDKKFAPLHTAIGSLVNAKSIQGGAGGAGGSSKKYASETVSGGSATNGSAYGGGNGGGGAGGGVAGSSASSTGAGSGGNGSNGNSYLYYTNVGAGAGGGGAGGGSKGTTGAAHGQGDQTNGGNKGGGAIYIFCSGSVTVSSTGIITADGGNGGNGESVIGSHTNYYHAGGGGGGGSGGGIISIIYGINYTNNGNIAASAGSGGSGGTATGGSIGNGNGSSGSNGSAGTVYTHKYVG